VVTWTDVFSPVTVVSAWSPWLVARAPRGKSKARAWVVFMVMDEGGLVVGWVCLV